MADQFTGTKSVHWSGAQAPDLDKEEIRGEMVGGTAAQKHEQEILAVSHGAPHPTGGRVKVDQPPDVSKLIHPSKFSGGTPDKPKEQTNE